MSVFKLAETFGTNACSLIMGDFNLRVRENHREDTSESMIFRLLFEEFFTQQFVTQRTRHGAVLDLVLSDNRSIVT